MEKRDPAPTTGQGRTSTTTAPMNISGGSNYLNAPENGATWCTRCWRPLVDPRDPDALAAAREAGLVVCCCDHDDAGGFD